MKRFKIENLSEVADAMYSDITEGIEETEFIGYYSDVSMVLKHLLMFDETIPCFIHITDAELDIDEYEKEYSIILDSNMNIWCEKAYMDGRYLFVSSERVYVADDCNPELLDSIDMNVDEVYEVTYGLEPEKETETERDCPKKDSHEIVTRVAKDKDGKVKGFEKSWDSFEDGMYYRTTYSFFSSNQNMLKNMLENFDIKY